MVAERIKALREVMKRYGIDIYMIQTSDFHGSEYVGAYFKCRSYISGFTGSAGTVVVTADEVRLWTDGRYFLQAGEQLKGTEIKLMKQGQPGVPTIKEYLEETVKEGQTLGFDGRTVSAGFAKTLKEMTDKKKAKLVYEHDLVGEIWTDRPELSHEPVFELDIKYAGKSREEKIADIRKALETKAEYYILTSLDDIAWLLNLRGNDVLYNPVFLSYVVMSQKEFILFANRSAFSKELADKLAAAGIEIREYNEVYEYIKQLKTDKLYIDESKTNYAIIANISKDVNIVNGKNLTLLPKACKNAVEVENVRKAHIKDGVAATRFMYYLKKNAGKVPMTEISLEEVFEGFRKEQENYIGPSFEYIVGYAWHGAIVHYSATEESSIPVNAENFLLIDSGGQYLEGTTDITRTFAMGPLTDVQKKHYTAVLRGNLNLGAVKFLHGCCGMNFDYLARKPLWDLGLDYNHGTGHGVGYFLNVHEGPNGFRWQTIPGVESAVFEEGMITSDEPGLYIEGEYGIRCENLCVVEKAEKNEFGQFLRFDTLTMVPWDLDAVDPECMNSEEKKLLNEYHQRVYDTISPFIPEEEKEWLKTATRAI